MPEGDAAHRRPLTPRPPTPRRYTAADAYQTLTSILMVILGAVILVRTLPLGVHLSALLVGFGFFGLGAYRLSFVVAYLRRRAAPGP